MVISNYLINNLLNASCFLCDSKNISKELHFICDECLKMFNYEFKDVCLVCKHPLNINGKCESCVKIGKIYYDSFHCIQYYTGFFKNIIFKLKYNNNYLVILLYFYLLTRKKIIKNNGVITAIPDTLLKKIKKGRSSLDYILDLFRKNDFKIKKNIIRRKNLFFVKQKNKLGKDRINQINTLYYLPEKNKNTNKGKAYLIDDIYTTGSTLNYGAKLLKESGFNEVNIVSFFRSKLDLL